MHNSVIHTCSAAVMLALAMLPYSCAAAQACDQQALVHNRDLSLTLCARRSAPRLLSFSAADGDAWSNQKEEMLPQHVRDGAGERTIAWTLNAQESRVDAAHATFVYVSAEPHLRAEWTWEFRSEHGPAEHRITVRNLTTQAVQLPLIESLRLESSVAAEDLLHNFYVEKGADTPSADGAHLSSVGESYRWIGRASTYAHPVAGEEREIIPVEFITRGEEEQTGWFAGIEFSGRTRILLEREMGVLRSVLGLNEERGAFWTRVEAGGEFVVPTAFLGAFGGGIDGAGNQLRRWVRVVLGHREAWADPQYPLLVNNSWGSGMQVDEPLALRMIADSKELGFEMFHLDAGWFRGVGDWHPSPTKFPHGLAPIADAAHKAGLRFGLWVDWTQAGQDAEPGALNVRDPRVREWLIDNVPPDWKPEEFKGQPIDIGVPEARAYAQSEVERMVRDYKLDMLEHDGYLVTQGCTRSDHPHAAPGPELRIHHDAGFEFAMGANSTDVSYHAVRAYYSIYEQVRREHPGLLFEICNDGGRMVDFGSAAHGDYFSITDTYDPLSNRRAFYDASFALPPAMLESYVERWPAVSDENFLYMLRSGMMGWMSLMINTTAWDAERHALAKRAFATYKEKLRPLIRDADLYHVAERPDGVHWDGVEYWDAARGKGVVFAFRGSTRNENVHTYVLHGLEVGRKYWLHFEDGTAADKVASGEELSTRGVQVSLGKPLSSELVWVEEAH